MPNGIRQTPYVVLLAVVVGLLALDRRTAPAETITLQVAGVGDEPIIVVSVEDFPDPKGVRYVLTTTLGTAEAARTFHVGLTRKGSKWSVDSLDGLKGGPFTKVASVVNKGASGVAKRLKGWAKLAATEPERAELLARAKALQAEMKADGKATVAAVNATATFDPKDLAVAQMAVALRYYDWLYATLGAVGQYGPKDKKAVNGAITTALDALYPRANAGVCTAMPTAPVYSMSSSDCPPDDFVPNSQVALSRECYGKNGLYQDQDFKCSAGAPQGIRILTANGWVPVDFKQCCLEHDRAFFCGGVTTSGQATGTGPGSWHAWQQADAALVQCIGQQIYNGYVSNSTAPKGIVIGAWMVYFSFTGNIFIWGDSTLVGDAWSNGWNDPAILDRRLDTCLCGGDQPVALCGEHCMVNDCSEPLPTLIQEAAFENRCDDQTCIWTCVEERENGVVTKRYKRKRVFDANGHVVPTPDDYDFSSCTPDYEMPCDCAPYQRPIPPAELQCQIPDGFFTLQGLPTAQNVSTVDP